MSFDAISGALGALLWEITKQLVGRFFKRRNDQDAAKRKQLGEQCVAAKNKINQCQQYAVEYLTAHCGEARKQELSRILRHETKLLGQAVKELNRFASELAISPVSTPFVTNFRSAVTWHLDSRSYVSQAHNSDDVGRVYSAGFSFQEALSAMQWSAA